MNISKIKKAIIFLPLISMFTLASCNPNKTSSSGDIDYDSQVNLAKADEITSGTYSGVLEDIVFLERNLASGSEYSFTYSAPNDDANIRVVSSNEDALTISHLSGNNYKIVTHNPGNSILKVYDSQEYLHFRFLIRVRTAHTAESVAKAAFDYDTYGGISFYGNHRLSCVDYQDSFRWQVSGSDDTEKNMNIVFDVTNPTFNEEWDMFMYSVSVVSKNEGSQTNPLYFFISRTADTAFVYIDAGAGEDILLNMFSPISLTYRDVFQSGK